jgi:hypothetical protein
VVKLAYSMVGTLYRFKVADLDRFKEECKAASLGAAMPPAEREDGAAGRRAKERYFVERAAQSKRRRKSA